MNCIVAVPNASSSPTIPSDMIAHRGAPVVDAPLVAGACRGFEGLILNRGRSRHTARESAAELGGGAETAPATSNITPLRIGVAESPEQIESASRLVCKRYSWRGYSLESFNLQCLPGQLGRGCREITFFVADAQSTLGTITLRLDGPEGLRADVTHKEEMARARVGDRCLGELTRLAVAEGVDSRVVLALLFGLVYTVGRLQHGVSDVFIEVNPRHVPFHVRALGFVVASGARFCERVRAPSVLLHLDVGMLESRLGLEMADVTDEPVRRYGT